MTRTAIRRWLCAAALTAGAGLGLAAYDAATTTASADDKPTAVTERPGGVLGRGLPGKPVRKLVDTVTDVVPVKVDKPEPKPEPAKDKPDTPPGPKPEPTHEPDPEPTRPAEPDPAPTTPADDHDTDQASTPEPEPTGTTTPAEPTSPALPLCDVPLLDGICQTVDDVTEVVDEVVPPVVVDVPPVVVDVPPAVVDVPPISVDLPPVAVTLPTTGPAPLPDADAPTTPQQPAPVRVIQQLLPTILGPTVGHTIATTVAAAVGELPAALAEDPPMECGELVTPTDEHYRAVLHRLDQLAAPPQPAARSSNTGCPGTPGNPDHTTGCDNATTSNGSSGQQQGQPTGDLTGGVVPPALDRLGHARPRSHLPASRHTCIEPGPA